MGNVIVNLEKIPDIISDIKTEDPRKTGLKNGLRQLTITQLQRVIDYDDEMVLDTYNYEDGKFCPLAIGIGLDTKIIEPSNEKVFEMLTNLGYSVYNTRGIIGKFYTNNRLKDLLEAANEVLQEKKMQTNNNSTQYRVRINGYIRVPQIRVILEDGTSPGIVNTFEALKMAKDLNLDLVEINPKSIPPVCKIMDYGKFKYEEKKKLSETRKKQKEQELKEITFRPNTDLNDLAHKLEQTKGFLADGDRIKFTIRFRGREISHPQVGRDKIDWIIKELTGLINPIFQISLEGKFMSVIFSPIKK